MKKKSARPKTTGAPRKPTRKKPVARKSAPKKTAKRPKATAGARAGAPTGAASRVWPGLPPGYFDRGR